MSGFATAKFRSGERLFGAGEPAEKLYVIQGGRVSLHDAVTDQTFAELGPGEFIGEHALLDCSVRSVTAVAEGEVVCLEMPSAAMRKLLSKEPAAVTTLALAATSTRRQKLSVSEMKRSPVLARKARPLGLLNLAAARRPSA